MTQQTHNKLLQRVKLLQELHATSPDEGEATLLMAASALASQRSAGHLGGPLTDLLELSLKLRSASEPADVGRLRQTSLLRRLQQQEEP